MTAAHYRLDNLVAIVDRNGLQITGSTEDVCQLAPLDEKFKSFGFAVQRCDGNDVGELVRTLESVPGMSLFAVTTFVVFPLKRPALSRRESCPPCCATGLAPPPIRNAQYWISPIQSGKTRCPACIDERPYSTRRFQLDRSPT